MSYSLEKIEELKEKIAHIEYELSNVLKQFELLTSDLSNQKETDWHSKFKLVDRVNLSNKLDEWFKQTGITNTAIGAEELQKMILKEGVKPEDNLLSRGIIEMREE